MTERLTHTPSVTPGQLSQVNGVISIIIFGVGVMFMAECKCY